MISAQTSATYQLTRTPRYTGFGFLFLEMVSFFCFSCIVAELMRRSREIQPAGDDLVISCLTEIIEDGSPVIVRSRIIGSGASTYKVVQSWTGHYGDLFNEFVEHPLGRDSAFRAQFLYFWFEDAFNPNCPGQLVAFSDHHLNGKQVPSCSHLEIDHSYRYTRVWRRASWKYAV